ncbi:ribosome modulation factor [Saccharophagus degradans]|uniref:Ribosome modulation factor n=2 Tax=Saccharophagus degradans TaxID=86304 RepID=RMF_SACD2|nr:ribosome modulation factor [Saccharophagus degradans]Q21JW8.1 RecName: Full=Ribosome modulation factor; Short=RMF [Saccharophagus degradans 2-40]ABD81011.1 ribosome modulation factor [Saccharophagus degradans 2-40]MBU2984168.1 ribosome modulation factor [Saccharophagus degradans]MDO6424173.1 ribosome modulation factor [Saccharophagus degradans]MDO6608220.1 ribosome modulation factor [Saccharophagus degradans]WGO96749.1 ribosome modulation factor [Saccharophagus degradans]
MKRQKRDHTSRAFTRGYQAGVEGRSRSLCPHSTGEIKQSWLTGWREGREDHWNGFNTLAQVQRISNIS